MPLDPSRSRRSECVVPEVPTEDQRRRSDKDGRFLYTCAVCDRMFRHRGNLGSVAGPRISVCGALLDPPEVRCMLADDFGEIWWLKGEPMPDLLEFYRCTPEHAAGGWLVREMVSGHPPALAATFSSPGGLEVPSSNLGAPTLGGQSADSRAAATT
jgi:hypothetical protein